MTRVRWILPSLRIANPLQPSSFEKDSGGLLKNHSSSSDSIFSTNFFHESVIVPNGRSPSFALALSSGTPNESDFRRRASCSNSSTVPRLCNHCIGISDMSQLPSFVKIQVSRAFASLSEDSPNKAFTHNSRYSILWCRWDFLRLGASAEKVDRLFDAPMHISQLSKAVRSCAQKNSPRMSRAVGGELIHRRRQLRPRGGGSIGKPTGLRRDPSRS